MRAAVLLMLAACGGGDERDEPVPATPLAGTLNGMAWTAMSATAKNASTAGEKTVRIHPDVIGCTGIGDEPYVALVLPWLDGVQKVDINGEATVFFFFDATAHLVLDGRVEISNAAAAVGSQATMRLRARFEDRDDDLFVEGEIAVTMCE